MTSPRQGSDPEPRKVPKDWHRADGPFKGCECDDCKEWREGFPGLADKRVPRGMVL